MEYFNLFIISTVVVSFTILVVLRVFFSKEAQLKRKLKSLRPTSIGNAKEGQLVKIAGRVVFSEPPLKAPLTGRLCSCWKVIVEEYKRSGRSGSWREVISETRIQPFYIEDDTGVALIRDTNPDVVIKKDGLFQSGTFNDATPELEAFLKDHGLSSTGFLGFNRQMKYKEGVFEEGEPVAAMGVARFIPDEKGITAKDGYRNLQTILVVDPPSDGNIVLSDESRTLK